LVIITSKNVLKPPVNIFNNKNTMNWEFIYNETLSWTVDGINVTFTTLNNIGSIEEVYLGWVAYRSISFTWNVITFTDAPPSWSVPSADYFKEVAASTAAIGDVTFWDIIEETYEYIGQEQTSESYPLEMVKKFIKKWIKKIKNEKFFKEKILSYVFNKAKDGSVVWYDPSTITVTARDYIPSTWALLLSNSTLVEYTWHTDWVINATAWYVYKWGDKFSIWYKIPTGVKRPAEVILNWAPLTYTDNREFVMQNGSNKWTIIHASDGSRYIFLPFSDEFVVDVKYIPDYSALVEDDDLADIIYEYSDVVSLYSAYKMLMFREDDRWQSIKQEFIEEKKRLKSFKARAVESINNWFNVSNVLNDK